ncbi:iron-containing alcohol dehydrogenase [Conexibacter sp. SYSU D00693]|uniref:iron-containing alcohol dehydrogenase n=1 Tax=Conexibacter sp. SYSU D00693 TaxID=2812560 RepID=UPI00196A9A53|nr:iron-containing alcohol dehydrogenase [Conexibacter sp. SYSU D00693]
MTGRGPRAVEIPRLLHVGTGSLRQVAALLDEHRFDLGLVLVGSGRGPSRALAEAVVQELEAAGVSVVHRAGLAGRLDQAAALAGEVIERGVTCAVAVGGGRVIDTVKLAAARTGVDFVSVPTAISNDGISSPVASLVGRDGARASHAARMPCGIVMDVGAIASAPARSLRAGLGDLVSNLTACLDWRLADRAGHDRYDAFAAMIAESAARPALDLADLGSAGAKEVLAHGLLLSGLAMAAAGTSRPCSGAEHLISHALDAQLGGGAALHGEQVALGTLVAAAAHRAPPLEQLHALFRRVGLPTCPEDLGLTRHQLASAMLAAPAVKPERWTILSDRCTDPGAAAELVAEAFPPVSASVRQLAS